MLECDDEITTVEIAVAIPITVGPSGVSCLEIFVLIRFENGDEIAGVEFAVQICVAVIHVSDSLDPRFTICRIEYTVTSEIKIRCFVNESEFLRTMRQCQRP